MARVYPQASISLASMTTTSQSETFTIWMKSLVCQSNGLTVYNSNGEIVYRVDNYQEKCGSEVHLMDLRGNTVFTIRRKKLRVFRCWDGYRWSSTGDSSINNEKPWFRVKKYYRIFMGDLACQVTIGQEKYWIVRLAQKLGFRLVDINGDVLAEAKQKQSTVGIALGDDVLALEIKPCIDHSLIMALVTVYGLINGKM